MTDGSKLYVTVNFAFNYNQGHLDHLVQFDILTQFFEHRNNLEGYIEDEEGARIEEGSEVDILTNRIYEAFDNKCIPELVVELLKEYEMYEILAEYHKPLCEEALKFKEELLAEAVV